jgi:ribonucleotide reductase alpha subunit
MPTRCISTRNRGAFIDQSQSLNLFVSEPNFAKVRSLLHRTMLFVTSRDASAADLNALLCVEEGAQNRYLTPNIKPIPPSYSQPGCYYLRTRAAVDAIKFTVDAATAG